MAQYNNLTSLRSLKAGDIVTYDTTTSIDFSGYKVKVELYGHKFGSKGAGYTTFIIDTSKLPQTVLSFNNDTVSYGGRRNDLIYGNTTNLYYRIAVAGNSGGDSASEAGQDALGGEGGSKAGADGGAYKYSSLYNGLGGTQTDGGKTNNAASTITTYQGSFGLGGKGFVKRLKTYGGDGGYGWYGGGGGYGTNYRVDGGGGGSGFIIGTSTTTYPGGYLDDNTSLQSTLVSAISEGSLTRGVSTETTPKMILTVVGTVVSPSSTSSQVQYFNGTEFVPATINYYNGTEFVLCDAYYYDGTEFKKI